jgi:hypothetical protein
VAVEDRYLFAQLAALLATIVLTVVLGLVLRTNLSRSYRYRLDEGEQQAS